MLVFLQLFSFPRMSDILKLHHPTSLWQEHGFCKFLMIVLFIIATMNIYTDCSYAATVDECEEAEKGLGGLYKVMWLI